jgi:hypothetical protein
MEAVVVKAEVLRFGKQPAWFHHNGRRLVVEGAIPSQNMLVLVDGTYRNAAQVVICVSKNRRSGILVKWTVPHRDNGLDSGRRFYTRDNFEKLFGLTNDVPDQYEILGAGVREGPWLNIPAKGSGQDGDPNISIVLPEETKEAIREFLKSFPNQK